MRNIKTRSGMRVFHIEKVVQALEQCYGLRAERIEPIAYGIWEEPFAVWAAPAGSGPAERFFAKRYRCQRGLAVMQRGLSLSQELRAVGFPAPRVIAPRDGSSIPGAELVANYGDERYILTEWAEGRTYSPGELPLACARPMGALLGRLHRLLGRGGEESWAYPTPAEAIAQVGGLLARYQGESDPFAAEGRAILTEQVDLLAALPSDFHESLPRPQIQGGCFNSFWIEQVLFHPDGSVAALVDWTDGAGRRWYLIDDIVVGIHLSALDRAATAEYVAGYQSENPLPRSEWVAAAADLTYGHLASINFLGSWLERPYRRMADWERSSERWHRAVPVRFRERELWLETILRGAGY